MDENGQQNSITQQTNINFSSNFTIIEKSVPSANLSRFVTNTSSGVPTGPSELSITEASSQCEYSSDEISFLGIWCVPSNVVKKPSVKLLHITMQRK